MTTAGVDHCAEQDHGCEQLCLNTGESFVCQCSEGFLINEDLKTCSSESASTLLLQGKGSQQAWKTRRLQRTAGRSPRFPLPRGGRGAVHWGLHAFPGRGRRITGTSFPSSGPGGLADDLTWLLGLAGADYCLLSNHGCEYSCVNTDRSFACQCPEGHVLRSDGKTCASECSEVGRQAALGTGIRGWGALRDSSRVSALWVSLGPCERALRPLLVISALVLRPVLPSFLTTLPETAFSYFLSLPHSRFEADRAYFLAL